MSTFDIILLGVIGVCLIGVIALIILIVKANKKIKQLNGTAKVKTKASKQQVPNYQQPQQPMASPTMNQAGMQQPGQPQMGMQQPANNMQPQMVNPTMNQVGMQQPVQQKPVVQQSMQQPVRPQIVKPDGTITSPGQPQMAPQNPNNMQQQMEMTQQLDVVNNQTDQGVNPTPVQ